MSAGPPWPRAADSRTWAKPVSRASVSLARSESSTPLLRLLTPSTPGPLLMVSTSSIRAHLVSASRKWPAMDSETAWKVSATGRGGHAPAGRGCFYPAVGQIEGGLVVPQAPGGRGAEREPAVGACRGIEVVGEQRGDGGAE